jgi:hypothetical protein
MGCQRRGESYSIAPRREKSNWRNRGHPNWSGAFSAAWFTIRQFSAGEQATLAKCTNQAMFYMEHDCIDRVAVVGQIPFLFDAPWPVKIARDRAGAEFARN